MRQRIALAFALACTAVVAALGLTLRTASEEMEEALVYQIDRFYQGANHAGGFGLGLAIVKRICDHYGWQIDVQSVPGQGASFAIAFP